MDPENWASSLVRTTADIGKKIVSIPGKSHGSFEEELQYIQTVYPQFQGDTERISSLLKSIVTKIASHSDAEWKSNLSFTNEYAPVFVDLLDGMFEFIDGKLDEASGRKVNSKIVVKDGLNQSKKRFMVESNSDNVIKACTRGIFVPEKHPFEDKVKQLYQSRQPVSVDLVMEFDPKMDEVTFEWIDNADALTRLAVTLESESMIAVDLENHSFHSYNGHLCLMQISTFSRDYIIDAIALRSEIGTSFRNIFANPSIVKVFHGAQSDIQWLQRDFNIFIVNMFDTFFAAKALGLPTLSLASLLLKYCNITTDKQYQLADWRIRPIPADMCRYARMDTHFLLYIFSKLVLELREKGGEDLVAMVFRQSSLSALALYKPEVLDQNTWRSVVGKSCVPVSEREVSHVKGILEWRDAVAREEDESPPAVLPNYMILKLAQGGLRDPEVVIRSCRHPLVAALKHLEALKNALSTGMCKMVSEAPLGVATHIKFPDSEDEMTGGGPSSGEFVQGITDHMAGQSVQGMADHTLEVQLSADEPPIKRSRLTFAIPANTKSTMASAFDSQVKIKSPISQDVEISSTMSIVKVAAAASELLRPNSVEVPCHHGESSDDEQRQVRVLRSGEAVDADQMLNKSALGDRKISLVKRDKMVVRSEGKADIDLLDISQQLFKNDDITRKAPSVKTSKVTHDRPGTSTRIGKASRSGNRTMTFYK